MRINENSFGIGFAVDLVVAQSWTTWPKCRARILFRCCGKLCDIRLNLA